jgi:hypothetical protein
MIRKIQSVYAATLDSRYCWLLIAAIAGAGLALMLCVIRH